MKHLKVMIALAFSVFHCSDGTGLSVQAGLGKKGAILSFSVRSRFLMAVMTLNEVSRTC